MPEDKELDEILDRWDSGFTPDSNLLSGVKSRIEIARNDSLWNRPRPAESLSDWARSLFQRPAFALGYAAVFMFVGIGVASVFLRDDQSKPDELTLSYRLSIDPLYRLETMAGPPSPGLSNEENSQLKLAGLGWLQGELDLSNRQFERVSALHTDYDHAFDELFEELLESYAEYRVLDKRRMSDDVIDYFQLYELLQTQKRLSQESSKLTHELLEKVSEVITPEQRERYERLIENLYPRTPKAGGSSINA